MDFHFLTDFTSKILKDDSRTKKDERQKETKTKFYKCKYCTKQLAEDELLAHEMTHDPEKPYQCPKCNFSSTFKKYIGRHIRQVHSGPGNYECEHCHKRFQYPNKLKNHMFTHTGEKPYSCDICDKSFSSAYSLKSHMYIHTNEKPYVCDICKYACRDSSTLRKHKEYHEPTRTSYSCTLCDTRMKNLLKSHVAEKHFKLDVRKHKCDKCDMAFKVKAALTIHIRQVHERRTRTVCSVCNKSYSNESNLKEHMQRHSGARKYVCNYKSCDKKYVDSSGLKKHLSKHHEGKAGNIKTVKSERQVECDYCGMRLNNKNNLLRHMTKYHKRGKNKYKCRVCEYQTNDKRRFRVHLHRYHDMTIYYCGLCDQKFRKLRTYNDHNEIIHRDDNKNEGHPELEVQVKQEPLDLEDMDITSVDLFDLEHHQVLGDLIRKTTQGSENGLEPNSQTDEQTNTQASKLEVMFEEDLEQYCQKGIMETDKLLHKKKSRFQSHIDAKAEKKAKKYVKKVTAKISREQKIKDLEIVRREYNKRIMSQTDQCENIKIKYYKCNKIENSKQNNSSQVEEKCDETESCDGNESEQQLPAKEKGNEIQTSDENITCDETKIDEENVSQTDDEETQGEGIDNDKDYECPEMKKTKSKLKLNTHQCYICFKLFSTKPELLDHCKDHFGVCQTLPIKKCPLCKFATKFNLRRHLKVIHDVDINILSHQLKNSNGKGNKFYYEVDSKNTENINKIEIIPSVRNLNKIAYVNIDANNRKSNNNSIQKTKLVKKGNEWVVEKEKVNIKYQDYLMPEINYSEIDTVDLDTTKMTKNEIYMTYLRKLYHIAKMNAKKILFPCSECEKICQHLCALKLHLRKHDKNAKPYKPKVYKDKALVKLRGKRNNKNKVQRNKTGKKKGKRNREETDKLNEEYKTKLENRNAVPNAIKNNHKCDPKLMDFYKTNIKGKDIEFWQFLKIFNKMGREKIEDFQDLEMREDLESYFDKIKKYDENLEQTGNNINESNSPKNVEETFSETGIPKSITNKNVKSNKTKFKRVIRISRTEYMKRNAIKNKLREEIAKRT